MSVPNGMAIRPTAFRVRSETRPGVFYQVQLPDCDCADFEYRRANTPGEPFCKHLQQAMLMAGWRKPEVRTRDLEWDEALAVLVRAGINQHAAKSALAAAHTFRSGRIAVGDAVTVVYQDRDSGLYTLELAG